jgi:hypothetical protein
VFETTFYADGRTLAMQALLYQDRAARALAPSTAYPPNFPYADFHIGDLYFLRQQVERLAGQGRRLRLRLVSPAAIPTGAYLGDPADMVDLYDPSALAFPAERGLPGLPPPLADLRSGDVLVLHAVVHLQPRPLTLLRVIISQLPVGAAALATLFLSTGNSVNLFSQLGFTLLSSREIEKLSSPGFRITQFVSEEGSDEWPAFRRGGLIIERA